MKNTNPPFLLHTQHDLLRLIDAAHLLRRHFDPLRETKDINVSQHIKRIRAVPESWDDFSEASGKRKPQAKAWHAYGSFLLYSYN